MFQNSVSLWQATDNDRELKHRSSCGIEGFAPGRAGPARRYIRIFYFFQFTPSLPAKFFNKQNRYFRIQRSGECGRSPSTAAR